jgi:hypothetical protein
MKNLLLTGVIALTLIACKSGGNGNGYDGPGGVDYTHNELAEMFINNLNLDADFNVTLTKKSTLEQNFVVIYDPYTDSYDAINIDNYSPSSDAAEYYFANSGRAFFDLDVIPGHYELDYEYTIVGYDYDGYAVWGYDYVDVWVPTRYRDRSSGILFEKTASTPKDLAKVAAIKEIATLDKKAKFLSSEFGLSLSRGQEVARLSAHWKKASLKGMTAAEQDNFSTELLGFSITAGKKAAKSAMEGESSDLNKLVNDAAKLNKITPEHASKLMTKMFGM